MPRPARPSLAALAGVAVAATLGALAALMVAAGAGLGRPALVAVLIPLQLLLAACWLAYVSAPGWIAGTVLAAGAAGVADVLATRSGADVVGSLAGVVAVAVVLAVLAALVRQRRSAVTDTLAAQISAVLVVVTPAAYVAQLGRPGGRDAVLIGLFALAAAGVGGRIVARLLPTPPWSPLSFLAGVGCWAATGALLGWAVHGRDGALLAAAVAAAGGLADLATIGLPGGRRSLLLGALLPLSVAAPVTYVLGRVLLA